MQTFPLVRPPQSKYMKSSRVILAPGEEIGEHITDKREELIIILKGSAILTNGGGRIILNAGDARFVGEGVRHNVKNESKEPLEYVYVVSLF